MIDVLNSEKVPETNPNGKNCAYARQRALFESKGENDVWRANQ